MRRPILCSLAALGVLLAPELGAQQDTARVTQSGRGAVNAKIERTQARPGRILGVFDEESGTPIPDAEVVDLYVDAVARTEAHGLIELSHFQSRHDSVAVRVRKLGYADTAFVVMVGPSDTIPIQVNLRKVAVGLPTVTTEATAAKAPSLRMQEFEDRRKIGMGKYILPQEMRRYDDRNIKDILIEHGIVTNPHGCRGSVKVIVNGDPGTSQGTREMALRDNGSNFEAVEFYSPAAAPLQFGGTNAQTFCGVVILWTREKY